jgi:hypothetical protein
MIEHKAKFRIRLTPHVTCKKRGLILYVRGHVKILDRVGIEAAVCECYKVVKDEYDRLLG